MTISVQHWDAFAKQPGKGNPAGIVLDHHALSDATMQAVAKVIDFNDTAFVLPSQRADFRIRYFAPRREVDLCGHATIAAFVALHRHQALPTGRDRYTVETNAGVLPIAIERSADGLPLVVMTQSSARFTDFSGKQAELARAIGIEADEFHPTLPILFGSTGRWTLIVPVRDLRAMRRMQPAPEYFAAALTDLPEASIHPFCLETIDAGAQMHARHFSSPASGTLEDAVTGTASGVLGAYYRRFVSAHSEHPLRVEQGYEIGREGSVQVWADTQGDDFAVRIAGGACFVRDIKVDL